MITILDFSKNANIIRKKIILFLENTESCGILYKSQQIIRGKYECFFFKKIYPTGV